MFVAQCTKYQLVIGHFPSNASKWPNKTAYASRIGANQNVVDLPKCPSILNLLFCPLLACCCMWFIVLLQVLPLERVIGCVQDTLVEISHLDDVESGVLRQKYLLHFLYKYISR